jgi:hypothetical protein
MQTVAQRPGWYDRTRLDGVTVGRLPSGYSVIIPGGGRRPVLFCPCCGMDIRTPEAAMKVADWLYPLKPETETAAA